MGLKQSQKITQQEENNTGREVKAGEDHHPLTQ